MAIAYVNSQITLNDGSMPIIATLAASGTGNLIVVMVIGGVSGNTIISMTDNVLNTYQAVPNTYISNGSVGIVDMWYAKNSLPGATAITITTSSPLGGTTMVAEYSGVSTGSVVDDGENHNTVGGNPKVGPVLTTTKTGDLLVSFVNSSAVVPTGVSSPWSLIPGDPSCEFVHYLNTGTPGTYQALFTPLQTDQSINSGAAFFAPSTGPSSKQKSSMFLVF